MRLPSCHVALLPRDLQKRIMVIMEPSAVMIPTTIPMITAVLSMCPEPFAFAPIIDVGFAAADVLEAAVADARAAKL